MKNVRNTTKTLITKCLSKFRVEIVNELLVHLLDAFYDLYEVNSPALRR